MKAKGVILPARRRVMIMMYNKGLSRSRRTKVRMKTRFMSKKKGLKFPIGGKWIVGYHCQYLILFGVNYE